MQELCSAIEGLRVYSKQALLLLRLDISIIPVIALILVIAVVAIVVVIVVVIVVIINRYYQSLLSILIINRYYQSLSWLLLHRTQAVEKLAKLSMR